MAAPPPLLKYPRTPHLLGSRLQKGDEDLAAHPFSELRGRHLVVEEKLDGANSALSFDADGQLWLQSRGHFLAGGARERHFDLFKRWAMARAPGLLARLGARYVVYGEWLYAKHTVFYDALPHYFLEFDIYDRDEDIFLSTTARAQLLEGLPLVSAPVLFRGEASTLEALVGHLTTARFQSSNWRARLETVAVEKGVKVERAWKETDATGLMEGLYVKVEDERRVLERFKWVRPSFTSAVESSESHWQTRTVLPNELAPGVDLFGGGRE